MDERTIKKIILELHPAIQKELKHLMTAEHLADATMEEVFLMFWAIGWLSATLNGYIPFDRQRVRKVLNLDEVNNLRMNDLKY